MSGESAVAATSTTNAPAPLSADAISELVSAQVQVALANLQAPGAGASASGAGAPSQLAKSKASLLSDVREIKDAAVAAQEVFENAYSDKYPQRAFEGKLSMMFAAMIMQKDIALAHVERIVQLSIAGKASHDNRMCAGAVESMATDLRSVLQQQRDYCDGQRVLYRVLMMTTNMSADDKKADVLQEWNREKESDPKIKLQAVCRKAEDLERARQAKEADKQTTVDIRLQGGVKGTPTPKITTNPKGGDKTGGGKGNGKGKGGKGDKTKKRKEIDLDAAAFGGAGGTTNGSKKPKSSAPDLSAAAGGDQE